MAKSNWPECPVLFPPRPSCCSSSPPPPYLHSPPPLPPPRPLPAPVSTPLFNGIHSWFSVLPRQQQLPPAPPPAPLPPPHHYLPVLFLLLGCFSSEGVTSCSVRTPPLPRPPPANVGALKFLSSSFRLHLAFHLFCLSHPPSPPPPTLPHHLQLAPSPPLVSVRVPAPLFFFTSFSSLSSSVCLSLTEPEDDGVSEREGGGTAEQGEKGEVEGGGAEHLYPSLSLSLSRPAVLLLLHCCCSQYVSVVTVIVASCLLAC